MIQASHVLPVMEAQIERVPCDVIRETTGEWSSRQTGLASRNTYHATRSPLSSISLLTRPATLADLPAIDALQKKHSKQLGFFPRAQMEGYIANGWVLVAEETGTADDADGADCGTESSARSAKSAVAVIGYLASRDRYLKRDELGIVYQLCVSEAARRRFVAATLLKAAFERASYGCRLFCCWCAQDLAANRFWESMGFVPLAFRSGSRKKDRVHIFWQKRIRAGDDGDASKGGTPWWFPAHTGGGSIREDRIVLPIPPGVRWNDAMPRVYPGKSEERREPALNAAEGLREESVGVGVQGSGDARVLPEPRTPNPEPRPSSRRDGESASREEARLTVRTGLHFGGSKAKPIKTKKPAPKFEPEQIAMSRQLRDRWLENVNADPTALLPAGRYDLVREIGATAIESAPTESMILPAPVGASIAA